jgi:spore coat protein U-like protein
VATIGIDTGSNNLGTTRRMALGTNYLAYELYKDPGRTQVWGAIGAAAMILPAAPSMQPRNYVIYGLVPQAQDVPTGTYIDRALATVSS